MKTQHTVQPHWEKVWPFLFKLSNDTEILILGMHPREMKACVHIRLANNVLAALFVTATTGDSPGIHS